MNTHTLQYPYVHDYTNFHIGMTPPEDRSKIWLRHEPKDELLKNKERFKVIFKDKSKEKNPFKFTAMTHFGSDFTHAAITNKNNYKLNETVGDVKYVEGCIYIFGVADNNDGNYDKIYRYDLGTKQFSKIETTLPASEKDALCETIGDNIYIFGDNGSYCFNTMSETITTLNVNFPYSLRWHRPYCIANRSTGRIYFIGGGEDKGISFYDPEQDEIKNVDNVKFKHEYEEDDLVCFYSKTTGRIYIYGIMESDFNDSGKYICPVYSLLEFSDGSVKLVPSCEGYTITQAMDKTGLYNRSSCNIYDESTDSLYRFLFQGDVITGSINELYHINRVTVTRIDLNFDKRSSNSITNLNVYPTEIIDDTMFGTSINNLNNKLFVKGCYTGYSGCGMDMILFTPHLQNYSETSSLAVINASDFTSKNLWLDDTTLNGTSYETYYQYILADIYSKESIVNAANSTKFCPIRYLDRSNTIRTAVMSDIYVLYKVWESDGYGNSFLDYKKVSLSAYYYSVKYGTWLRVSSGIGLGSGEDMNVRKVVIYNESEHDGLFNIRFDNVLNETYQQTIPHGSSLTVNCPQDKQGYYSCWIVPTAACEKISVLKDVDYTSYGVSVHQSIEQTNSPIKVELNDYYSSLYVKAIPYSGGSGGENAGGGVIIGPGINESMKG